MKKLLITFASFVVIFGSASATTAWVKNPSHMQVQDPDHQLGRDVNYGDFNFGNFQTAMHPFSFGSLDPTIADVNVNQSDIQGTDVYNDIATYLDQRLVNYYAAFHLEYYNLLAKQINTSKLNSNFKIIDLSTGLAWKAPTLSSGQYECYNLELVNLLNNSSFNFSLNYCNFNLSQMIEPTNATPNANNEDLDIGDTDGHFMSWDPNNHSPNPYTTIELNNYLQNVNHNPGLAWPINYFYGTTIKNYNYLLNIDNYFMNPITWKWNADVLINYYEWFPALGSGIIPPPGPSYRQYSAAELKDSSDQAGHNSQINYKIDQNNVAHQESVIHNWLPGGEGPDNHWDASTLAESSTGVSNGKLQECADRSGWAANKYVQNAWNENGKEINTGWGRDAEDLLYVDQYYSANGNNEFDFNAAIGGISDVEGWPADKGPGHDWNIQWSFHTTELDTNYKDVFTQATADPVSGLENFSDFMTYNDPNQIIKNEDELYYLYNADQTVIFKSSVLTSAYVNNKRVPLDQSYQLNGSSTQSVGYFIQLNFKDPSTAALYYGGQDLGQFSMNIVIKNGYDFSQGINATTFNKTNQVDNLGDTIYDVDVYIDGKSASQLSDAIHIGGGADTKPVFSVLSNHLVVDPPWADVLTPDSPLSLIDVINQYGTTISSGQQGLKNNLNTFLSGTGGESAEKSILGGGGTDPVSYRNGLVDRIHSFTGPGPKNLKGIIFHFVVSWDGAAFHCQDFDTTGAKATEQAYDQIVQPQEIPQKAASTIVPQQQATFNKINNLIEKDIIKEESGQLQYQGSFVVNPHSPDKDYIDTSDSKMMQDLINSLGGNWSIAGDCPNFNQLYSQYISFDKINIYNQQKVTMHLKVGSYTKDYQVTIWWRSSIPK